MSLYIPTSPQYEREMLVPVDQGVMCTVWYGTGSGEPAFGVDPESHRALKVQSRAE